MSDLSSNKQAIQLLRECQIEMKPSMQLRKPLPINRLELVYEKVLKALHLINQNE